MNTTDFTGYDMIARDAETNETLFMGKIAAYNKIQNIIEVDAQPQADFEQRRMRVLIFQEGQAYDSYGTYRKLLNGNQIGVALYKGTVKADRKNERFTVDLSSEIIEQITENGVSTLEHEIPIHILDISRSGVRIQGEGLDLKKYDKITIRFTIRKQTKKYYAQIVRIGKEDPDHNILEYGCELLTYQQYNGIM